LRRGGACADVIYRHIFETEYLSKTKYALSGLGKAAISLVTVPEYPGVLHVLAIWGNRHIDQNAKRPRNEEQRAWRQGKDRPALKFYDPHYLKFHLYLPPFLRRAWSDITQ
jgi:hypothetical protein